MERYHNKLVENYKKIQYIHKPFTSYIESCNHNKYDIIHTSNITDWLNKEQINILLLNIKKCLKINGVVIMRRLNGDYDLELHVAKHFQIINCDIDKSLFYSQVVVGKKIDNCS